MSEVWKQALAEHTGQWAFVLSISRRMVYFLTIIRDGEYHKSGNAPVKIGSPRNHFVSTTGCLEARGLIERVHKTRAEIIFGQEKPYTYLDWKLTPAGQLVCQLLVFANLMPEKKRTRKEKAA